MKCPDDGTCHHECATRCFRVQCCAPLSASGWDDWPGWVKLAHGPVITVFHGGQHDGHVDTRAEAPYEWIFHIPIEPEVGLAGGVWVVRYRLRGPVEHLTAHYDLVP